MYHTDGHELSVNCILTSSLESKGKVEINDGSMHCEREHLLVKFLILPA